MKYGTILLWPPGHRDRFEQRVRSSEELGYDIVGVGDSPNAYRDWPATLMAASAVTSSVQLGVAVTSPHGRHPVHTANAMSTVQEASDGRSFLGIGTGGSAATSVGGTASKQAELRSYIEATRSLLNGDPASYEGAECPALSGAHRAPILLSAYGPAAMRLAGEIGDGVILAVGAAPELVSSFVTNVREGAIAAGRSPDDVEIWVMSRVSVRENRDDAITDVKANLASAGAFGLRSPAQMATVPAENHDQIVELQQRYDPTKHVMWDGPNAKLVDELGVGDYLASRFGIIGTPQECRDQVEALERAGVNAVLAPAVDRDPEGLIERFAQVRSTSPTTEEQQ